MNNSTDPKEYRTSTYWLQFILWIICCLLAGRNLYKSANAVIHRPEYLLLEVFGIIIQFSVLVYMFHMIQDVRLSISENGIKFSMWSRTIYADWNQIKQLGYEYWQKQLVIENPVVEKRKAWWLWLDFQKLRKDDNFKFVPFNKLTWEKFDEIEAEVKKQMPHLFEQSK